MQNMPSAKAARMFELYVQIESMNWARPVDGWVPFSLTKNGTILASKRTKIAYVVGALKPTGPWEAVAKRMRLHGEFVSIFTDASDEEIEEYNRMKEDYDNRVQKSSVT